jgi:charged multivesicular body protein 2A
MTPAERLRKHQRALEKTQRELDRERVKLENQEKKLVQDIKKSAKNGQIGACKIQAKDLVRTRRLDSASLTDIRACLTFVEQIYYEVLPDAYTTASNCLAYPGMATSTISIPHLRLTNPSQQTVRSNEQMMQSMKGATSLLGTMNRQMNLPALQRIAMEFERENDIMDQRQEMMDDAIDDVTGLEDEEEGEEVVNQVLDEIGVDLRQAVNPDLLPQSLCLTNLLQFGETPSGLQKNADTENRVAQAIGGAGGQDDDDLLARMDNLRK